MVSSITVFIFSSLLFFIIGFLSGFFTLRFRYKHAKHSYFFFEPQANVLDHDQPLDLCEAVLGADHQLEDEDKIINLASVEEDRAYGPVQLKDQREFDTSDDSVHDSVQREETPDPELELIRTNIVYVPVQTCQLQKNDILLWIIIIL